jgi:hypothetical protein
MTRAPSMTDFKGKSGAAPNDSIDASSGFKRFRMIFNRPVE